MDLRWLRNKHSRPSSGLTHAWLDREPANFPPHTSSTSAHTHTRPRPRPRQLPLPLLLPLAASSLCLATRRFVSGSLARSINGDRKIMRQRQGLAATPSRLLSCHSPNFRPPQKRHSSVQKPTPAEPAGAACQQLSMCPCTSLPLSSPYLGPWLVGSRLALVP